MRVCQDPLISGTMPHAGTVGKEVWMSLEPIVHVDNHCGHDVVEGGVHKTSPARLCVESIILDGQVLSGQSPASFYHQSAMRR
jgi:hypothetical protein